MSPRLCSASTNHRGGKAGSHCLRRLSCFHQCAAWLASSVRWAELASRITGISWGRCSHFGGLTLGQSQKRLARW